MPSLKSLKMRITSVKSTQKITKAMKMVAAAKLRRAQEAAEAARPYSVRMAAVMASLASRVTVGPESPRLLAGTGKDQVHLLVVCSSERGLAGGFNSNIAKLARRTMDELLAQGKTVKLLFVGNLVSNAIAALNLSTASFTAGTFTLKVPAGTGKLYLEAVIDEDGDGRPGPQDPRGTADRYPVTVKTSDVADVLIRLVKHEPPGGKGTQPAHAAVTVWPDQSSAKSSTASRPVWLTA